MILRGVLGLGVAKSAHLKGNDEFDLRLHNTGTKDSKTQYFINPLLGVRNSPARTSRAGDASRRGSLLGAARKHWLLSGLWVKEGLIRRQKFHLQCLCSLLLKHHHRKKRRNPYKMEKEWGVPRPTIYLAASYTSTSVPAGSI